MFSKVIHVFRSEPNLLFLTVVLSIRIVCNEWVCKKTLVWLLSGKCSLYRDLAARFTTDMQKARNRNVLILHPLIMYRRFSNQIVERLKTTGSSLNLHARFAGKF